MKGMLRGVLFFPPEQGWQGNTIRKGAKQPENRVTRFPVEKSGAAPIVGGERSEPITSMLIMPYDTDSQSRNAPCVPFRGRGPRSGEGVDGGNPDYDT